MSQNLLRALGFFALSSVLVFSTISCAKVKVKKVPTPTQYSVWTDHMQSKADKLEGFRFYLPRPFINVFESFPVRTDIYLADGYVSPDGKYVIVESVRSESGLNDYLAGIQQQTKIPSRVIFPPSDEAINAAKQLFSAQSGAVENIAKALSDDDGARVQTGGLNSNISTKREDLRSASAAKTGINTRDVRNDNGAFAYQPMRGNMDIAYLPDFEEQYAASSSAGLGNARFSVNLGQGWSLQGFNSLTDNSELNKRIFDIIDESIAITKSLGKAAVGIPPVDLSGGVTKLLQPQSGPPTKGEANPNLNPGSPVTLKIVVIHYAAKGLYPVIKPRELQERVSQKGGYFLFFDMFKVFPRPSPATAFDPTALQRAQMAVDNESGRFTVPRYPYQYISFNTFRYMAIEVIKTDATPFGQLYDKTGTAGDPGDRQVVDLADILKGSLNRNVSFGTEVKEALAAIKDASLTVAGIANAFVISSAEQAGDSFTIRIDAGADASGRKYSIEDVVGAVRTVARSTGKWSTDQLAGISESTVILNDSAKARINPPLLPVTKSAIEDSLKGKVIPSGATPSDGFTFSNVLYDAVAKKLTAVVATTGTVTKKYTEVQLEGTVKDLLNNTFQGAPVNIVDLDVTGVTGQLN